MLSRVKKLGYFDNFSGKNHVKFRQFVNFSYILWGAKMFCPLKLTELLCLWPVPKQRENQRGKWLTQIYPEMLSKLCVHVHVRVCKTFCNLKTHIISADNNYFKTNCGAKAQQTQPVLHITASRNFSELTKKCNQVVPWSLHTLPENFMQIGPAVFS